MRFLALICALLALPSTLLAQQIPGCGFGSVGRELGVELGFEAGVPLTCSIDQASSNMAPTALLTFQPAYLYAGERVTVGCECYDFDGGPDALTLTWTAEPSAGTCAFGDANAPRTWVECSSTGSVWIECTCDDGADSHALPMSRNVVDLATQLGGNLIAWYEVPSVIDSAITVTSGRIEQLSNRAGGSNHMTAAGATNRPLYYAVGGPENEPFARITADSTVPLALAAPITAPSPRRVGIYVVAAGGHHNTVGNVARIWNTATSYPWRLRDWTTLRNDAAEVGIRHSVRIPSTATVESIITSPNNQMVAGWQLYSFRNPASQDSVEEINGVQHTPAFSPKVTTELHDSFTEIGFGAGNEAAGNTGGRVKAMIVISDPTDARDAVVRSYIGARWPSTFNLSKGSVIPFGTSNSVSAEPYQQYTHNWCGPGAHWTRGVSSGGSVISNDWEPGDTLTNRLITAANYHSGRPINFFGFVGENDNSALAASLEASLNTLISHVETETGRTDATWTLVRIPSWSTRINAATMRAAIENVVAANPTRRAWIDADDAGNAGDGIHYSADGYQLLIPRACNTALDFFDAHIPRYFGTDFELTGGAGCAGEDASFDTTLTTASCDSTTRATAGTQSATFTGGGDMLAVEGGFSVSTGDLWLSYDLYAETQPTFTIMMEGWRRGADVGDPNNPWANRVPFSIEWRDGWYAMNCDYPNDHSTVRRSAQYTSALGTGGWANVVVHYDFTTRLGEFWVRELHANGTPLYALDTPAGTVDCSGLGDRGAVTGFAMTDFQSSSPVQVWTDRWIVSNRIEDMPQFECTAPCVSIQ